MLVTCMVVPYLLLIAAARRGKLIQIRTMGREQGAFAPASPNPVQGPKDDNDDDETPLASMRTFRLR